MKWISHMWNRISGIGINNLSETEVRTVTILNRINFFIVVTGLLGFVGTEIIILGFLGGKFLGIGAVRLLFVMLAGLLSFALTWYSFHAIAKLLTSTLPVFFLVAMPTLLGNMAVEYYFYYPFACTAASIIPILLFPARKDRTRLLMLVVYCFILSVTIDNLLTYFAYPETPPDIFRNRYFFYKLAQVLIFVFTVSIVYTLKVINTRYEAVLTDQNILLQSQKEELSAQSEKLYSVNEELVLLNKALGISNLELENLKNNLEDLVESRTSALSESETRFRSIFENANDAIFIMKDEVFFDCNLKTTVVFGCAKNQIIGMTPYYFSPPVQPDGKDSKESAMVKIGQVLNGESQRFEWQHVRLDGSIFDAEVSLNRIELEGQLFILAIVRDITKRKKSETALAESEKNFRSIFDKTKHGILIFGKDLKILAANRAVTEMTGYTLDENTSLYATDFVAAEQHAMIKERLMRLIQKDILTPSEYKVRFRNGEIHIIESETSIMEYYGQEVFLVMLRDVTHIREAEHKVMEAIIHTEEAERSRIAQDLHDGLGPVLSTIKLYFQVYKDTTDENKKVLLTAKLKSTIEEAIKGVSEISHNISPHVLRNYGFYAALKQFIHRIALTNVIKINLECSQEPELTPNAGIILYRAITELVNNSIRHAQCHTISIVLNHHEGQMYVEYADDGVGFDVNQVLNTPSRGSGVQNILNRIKVLQGIVEMESMDGKGMRASLIIPV